MNASEAHEQYIGKVFRLPVPGTALEVDVRVDDRKQSLGHDRFLALKRRRNPAWPQPNTVSARARIQRLTRGNSLRGTAARCQRLTGQSPEKPTPLKHAGRRRT
jgi:hypothetical protein